MLVFRAGHVMLILINVMMKNSVLHIAIHTNVVNVVVEIVMAMMDINTTIPTSNSLSKQCKVHMLLKYMSSIS